jgi:hypothetical protein
MPALGSAPTQNFISVNAVKIVSIAFSENGSARRYGSEKAIGRKIALKFRVLMSTERKGIQYELF